MKKRCPTHMNITVTINRTYVLQQLRLWTSEELPGMRQASRNWRRKAERLQINPATPLEPLLTLVREATSADTYDWPKGWDCWMLSPKWDIFYFLCHPSKSRGISHKRGQKGCKSRREGWMLVELSSGLNTAIARLNSQSRDDLHKTGPTNTASQSGESPPLHEDLDSQWLLGGGYLLQWCSSH